MSNLCGKPLDRRESIEPNVMHQDLKGNNLLRVVPLDLDFVGEKVDLEDALDQIGAGRYTYGVLIISCFTLVAVATEIFGIGLLTTSSQCDLELDTYRKGIIGSVPMLGILVSSHTWGYVADTRGRRFALLVALSGSCTLGLVSSFVTHWIALALLKLLSVMFASGASAVVYPLLVEMAPRALRGRYVMIASTCLMLTQTVIACVGHITLRYNFSIPLDGLGINYRPWRLLAQVFAIANGSSLLMFITCVYESPKFYVSQGREEEAMQVLRNIYAMNTGNDPGTFSVKSISMHEDTNIDKNGGLLLSMWNQTAPLFHRKFIKNTLLVMYVAAVVFSTAPAIIMWLPHIVNAFMRASPALGQESHFCGRVVSELLRSKNASVNFGTCNDRIDDLVLYTMMSLGALCTTIGLVVTVLGKCLGKRSVVIILNIISGLSCFVLNHVTAIGSLAIFILINSSGIVMGIVSAFAVEIYPTYLRSMAVRLTVMAGRGASFVVINFIGVQIENNCENFFYLFGAFIISAALAGAFLPGEQRVKEKNRPEVPKTN